MYFITDDVNIFFIKYYGISSLFFSWKYCECAVSTGDKNLAQVDEKFPKHRSIKKNFKIIVEGIKREINIR